MMRHCLTILIVLVASGVMTVEAEAQFWRGTLSTVPQTTVANLGTPVAGSLRYVTDGNSATDCTTGGASTGVLCVYDGTSWAAASGGGGSGDITDVYDCSTGNCASITLSDTDLLDMSSVSVTTATEGLILPQHATDCSTSGTAEGQVCWEADSDDLYVGDGTTVAGPFLKTEVDTLDTAFDRGKTIDGANSVANAVRIGDGTTPICLYTDASLGPQVRPCTDANVRQLIPTNFNGGFYDEEGASDIFTIDPDAASVNAMYTFASGYRPLKSIYLPAGSLSVDGTQCADPAEVTINSGWKGYTIICTENDAGRMHGSVKMPDSWDGGTITLEVLYIQTAADTGSVALEAAAACRGIGETMNGTYGTEVEIDDAALVGSNAIESTTSGAITANGTCAAGDFLYFYVDIDATDNPTTAAATLNFVGVKMEYSTSSLSD